MPEFNLSREWSGYSRGTDFMTVEADTLEEALEMAEWSEDYDQEVTRDDREKEEWEND